MMQLSNYSSFEGVLYCKPHYDQLFKMTGSLDKSFEGTLKPTLVVIFPQYFYVSNLIYIAISTQVLRDLLRWTDLLIMRYSTKIVIPSITRILQFINPTCLVAFTSMNLYYHFLDYIVQNHVSSRFSSTFVGTQDKCVVCKKTVYPIEKVCAQFFAI